jgi:prevent-host-death family protein
MKIASLAEVKAKFSAYVKSSGHAPVVITRNGKAVAAIIPLEDDDALERLMLGYSPKLRAILAAARQRIRTGHGLRHDQFWRSARLAESPRPKRPTRRRGAHA